jgi:signal peptidase I
MATFEARKESETMAAVKVGFAGAPTEVREEWRQFCFGTNPVRTFKRVIIWCLGSILFFNNLLIPIQIVGSSMSPTYKSGSLNFVNKLSYTTHNPTKGDVIALEAEGELLLKRIVAAPGEKVSIHAGKLHVNGLPVKDAFAESNIPWEMAPVMLGNNEFFVIGDNRASSVFCKVHRSQILGKIIF